LNEKVVKLILYGKRVGDGVSPAGNLREQGTREHLNGHGKEDYGLAGDEGPQSSRVEPRESALVPTSVQA
jgi:hypothetical protein